MPKISVVTTSYNYADYIRETIESVINQTFEDWELIIVDDGSDDNSVEIIKSYCKKDNRIKLYTHEGNINKGLRDSVFLGIQKASSDWIAFLESDDIFKQNCLEEKFKILEKYPNTDFIFSDVEMIGDKEIIEMYNKSFVVWKEILLNRSYPNTFPHEMTEMNLVPTFSTVITKKKLLLECDFNTPLKPLLDHYLWVQFIDKQVYYIDAKLTKWRMHNNSYIYEAVKNQKIGASEKFRAHLLKCKYMKNRGMEYFIKYLLLKLSFLRKKIIRVHFKEKKIYIFGKCFGKGSVVE